MSAVITIRVNKDLRDKIKLMAKADNRTVSGYMSHLLTTFAHLSERLGRTPTTQELQLEMRST